MVNTGTSTQSGVPLDRDLFHVQYLQKDNGNPNKLMENVYLLNVI